MAGYGKNDKPVAKQFGQNDKRADLAPAVPSAPTEAPGWFEPGSKSEAALRGFSNAATFGFGDEIQAALRSLAGNETYQQLRDQERMANSRAMNENPWSFAGGSMVGAIPQALGVGKAVNSVVTPLEKIVAAGTRGAIYGGAQGAGNAETMADVPSEMGKEAAIGGVLNAGLQTAVPLAAGGAKLLEKMHLKTPTITPPPILEGPVSNEVRAANWKAYQDYKQALARSAAQNAVLPATSGVGYAAYNRVMGKPGESTPFAVDPISAAGEVGADVLKGAVGMYAGKKLINTLAKDVTSLPGGAAAIPDQPGQSSFPQLKSWLSKYMEPAAGAVEKEVAAEPGQLARRQAMEATTTPEGRAATNTTSPLSEEQMIGLLGGEGRAAAPKNPNQLPEGFTPGGPTSKQRFGNATVNEQELANRQGSASDLLKHLSDSGVDITNPFFVNTQTAKNAIKQFGWTPEAVEKEVMPLIGKVFTQGEKTVGTQAGPVINESIGGPTSKGVASGKVMTPATDVGPGVNTKISGPVMQKLADAGVDITNADAMLWPKAQKIMADSGMTPDEIKALINHVKGQVGPGSIEQGATDLFESSPLMKYLRGGQ